MQTHRYIACAAFFSLFTLHHSLLAQQVRPQIPDLADSGTAAPAIVPIVTATTAVTTSGTDEEVVQMSVFNVDATKDQGYQSLSTASGSRLNTSLKDTPATISPFSQEFLNDIGATTVEDMLSYAGNADIDSDDGMNNGDNDSARNAGSQNNFRLRGMAMDVSLDNAMTGNPIDTYNVDRAEISYGPNSILYGMGSAGGLVTLSTKRANLQRNTTKFQNVVGTWNNLGQAWNYYRATLDYNLVLMPKVMALRLNGLYQEGSNNSWRKWMESHNKRINPTLTLKPFKNTTITLSYETGRLKEGLTAARNGSDGITGWLAWRAVDPNHGILPTFNGPAPQALQFPNLDGTTYSVVPVRQLNGNGGNSNYVFIDNNTTLYDFRQAYESVNMFPNSTATNVRLPADMSSYNYSTSGPGGQRDQKFDRYGLTIEQSIGNVNLQFSYNHNSNKSTTHFPQGQDSMLQADPNLWISTNEYTGATGIVRDPYSGQFYMEDNWRERKLDVSNNSYRLTAENTFNLHQYGRHRIVLNFEHTDRVAFNNALAETLIDQDQRAAFRAQNPGAAVNQITRRHYAAEGDFSNYYPSDWQIPFADVYMNGNVYHSAYVASQTSNAGSKTRDNSIGSTLQSYLLKDSLVLTVGVRTDFYDMTRGTQAKITNPNDPRILNKSKVLNEWDFVGWNGGTRSYQPYTFSAGGVWHATTRHSFFVNYSTNRSTPYDINRTVLPNGTEPPLSIGRTLDYGVIFDLLGDDRVYLRLTNFDTRMSNIATIQPNNANNYGDNATLGSTNLFNIYDALYYLHNTSQTGFPPTDGSWAPFQAPNGDMVQPGMNAGPMPMDQYFTITQGNGFTILTPAIPSYNAGMYSTHSKGYEAEITANLSRSFTMRIAFSWTKNERNDLLSEIINYYNANISKWMAMADPDNPAYVPNPKTRDGIYYVQVESTSGTHIYTLKDYILQQLYADGSSAAIGAGNTTDNTKTNASGDGTSVRQGISNQLLNQSGAMAVRPIKLNITARYAFQTGVLKGLAIGGSMRYQSRNLMPDPKRLLSQDAYLVADGYHGLGINPDVYTDTATMIKGNSITTWSAFITHRSKLSFLGINTNATFQLNVDNLFNQNLITIVRLNQYGAIVRTNISTPRFIRFTATFDF